LLLVFAIWTIRNQMKTVIFALVLGIIGTVAIFFLEFGYTYRKAGRFQFGRLKNWLRVHILIGMTGPLIIVIHTRLNFHGFAGWLALWMAVVVASGFVGRYIFRQIPRSIKGRELTLVELGEVMREIERRLDELLTESPHAERLVKALRAEFADFYEAFPVEFAGNGDAPKGLWALATSTVRWHIGRLRMRRMLAGSHPDEHWLLKTLEGLEFERLALARRVRFLGTSKTLLARWRILHIPLTLTLFVGILIHVGSILYYGKVLP